MRALAQTLTLRLPIWVALPIVLAALAIGLLAGRAVTLATARPCPLSASACAEFDAFWQAWQITSENYVDPEAANPTAMLDGAIAGMADSLGDSGHTRYLSPEIAQAEREALSGRFEGVGIYLQVRDGEALVVEPLPSTPAERAGVQPGDRILAVDGESVRGYSLDRLRAMVRGPSGSQVTLTLQGRDDAAPRDVTLVRSEIQVPSTSWRMIDGEVALIRLNEFSERAGDDVRAAAAEARAQGASAIVLDLRNNPGGLVSQLVEVASEFLPEKTTILIEQERDGKQRPYRARAGGATLETPLVVLVNGQSASSAEILAAALSEAGRAQVVGTATFGTATVLRPYTLRNGGELRLGISQWLTPGGKQVRGTGITPDVLVALERDEDLLTPSQAAALSPEGLRASADLQLRRALELLGR